MSVALVDAMDRQRHCYVIRMNLRTKEALDATALADYAEIVGHLLAKAHAHTSGASMIAGYVGSSDKLDLALRRFARAYAGSDRRRPSARWCGPSPTAAFCQSSTNSKSGVEPHCAGSSRSR